MEKKRAKNISMEFFRVVLFFVAGIEVLNGNGLFITLGLNPQDMSSNNKMKIKSGMIQVEDPFKCSLSHLAQVFLVYQNNNEQVSSEGI